jgi:uncharacterized protein YkwD
MKRMGLFLFLGLVTAASASQQIISRPPPVSASAALFTNYTAASFARNAEARRPIDPANINQKLLEAAVFHETNRRRAEERLPALRYDAKAHDMGRLQARAMAKDQVVEHENPDPKLRTMQDRAKAVGLRPRVLAENVASAFGRQYKSGKNFYVREENGRTVYSYEPEGPPIPMHTYLSFAEELVESWMQSPGHRKNILHKEPEYLGCACELAPKKSGMETFYCAQVFFSPMENR